MAKDVRGGSTFALLGGMCRGMQGIQAGFITLALILLGQACLLTWESFGDSPTWDEVGHLAAGIDLWRTGSTRLYCVNPPLIRAVACLPVMAWHPLGPPYYYAHFPIGMRPEFLAGKEMVRVNGARYFTLMRAARIGVIPFALLGTIVCYLWASALYGKLGGVFSAALWAYSPTVLGFGHLITPDVGAASLGALAAYVYWRWLKSPSWRGAIMSGAILGLADLSKFTWLVAFFLWPVLSIAFVRGERPRMLRLIQLAVILLVALWIINIAYGFDGSFQPLGEFRFISPSLRGTESSLQKPQGGNRFADSAIGRVPIPLPRDMVEGLDLQKADFDNGLPSYLHGQWRLGGWWYYYFCAMSVKEPIGTLVLLGMAAGASLVGAKKRGPSEKDVFFPWILAAAIVGVVSSQTGFSHHLRYVLPAYPFLFISVGRLGYKPEWSRLRALVAPVACLLWVIIESIAVAPHSLSYFNEIAGGPKRGHRYLGNSNADWGQDLFYLASWVRKNPQARPIHLGYDMPLIDPKGIGIESLPIPVDGRVAGPPLNDEGPRPGWYVISVNQLHNRWHQFDYFQDLLPVDWVGSTMPVYHVTMEEANRLRRKYGLRPLSGVSGTQPSPNMPN